MFWQRFLVVLSIAFNFCVFAQDPVTIVVGEEDSNGKPSNVGWTDGVCYKPIMNGVYSGDTLEFWYAAHDVYRMDSYERFLNCNFTDAKLLAGVGEGVPYRYRILDDDINSTLYFACSVGSHCTSGNQKLQVRVTTVEEEKEERLERSIISSYVVGSSSDDCQKVQELPFDKDILEEIFEQQQQSSLSSECSDPVLGDDGYFRRTCLSGPATLTPGGVINRLFVLQYPFPKDHRVEIGQRTFEFVHDDVNGSDDVIPVPVNQLYVHHLAGSVVFGQGTEGVRQEAPDAPFSQGNYALLSGDESDTMIFHIIDLREVDDWLACIECRCQNDDVSYMESLSTKGNLTGGVDCCTNCTSLTGPTLDYRMRYNISYRELDDMEPIQSIQYLLADISPAVGKNLEHDVYSWEYLPEDEKNDAFPYVQYLERIEPFNVLFKERFFERDFTTTKDEVQLLRCVAHLHVAAIDMWLEDYETGERLCDGQTTYGTDPNTDKDFLISVSVDNHDPPLSFPPDRMVRMVTRYNATNLHTGVMGYWFVFITGEEDAITHHQVNMTVDISDCLLPTCNTTMLPKIDMEPFELPSTALISTQQQQKDKNNDPNEDCVDTLKDHPACMFGEICNCEVFVNAPQVVDGSGCDGIYESPTGNVEVRKVCANYCGCEISTVVEKATTDDEDSSCVDTLAESPSCTFGSLCDCDDFVNAPESSGCDGVYASIMGDIVVRSVCSKYCGCDGDEIITTEEETTTTQQQSTVEDSSSSSNNSSSDDGGCTDKLRQDPTCTFGQICECEEFVNAPESEGCGGNYISFWGNIVVNDVCAKYCNACERTTEELFEEAYTEVIGLQLRERCHFATSECKSMLANLYACGSGQPGIEQAHPMIQTVVTEHGQKLAMKNAKLGDPSLHSSSEEQGRPKSVCSSIEEGGEDLNDSKGSMTTSSDHTKRELSIMLILTTISFNILLIL